MSQPLHPLERRAQMLTGKLTQRMSDIGQSLQAANGRVPFKSKLSQNAALDWWSKHRYDALGQRALATLDPQSVFNLDAALNRYTANQQEQGVPQSVASPFGQAAVPQGPTPSDIAASMQGE